jgi:hypothetical protein
MAYYATFGGCRGGQESSNSLLGGPEPISFGQQSRSRCTLLTPSGEGRFFLPSPRDARAYMAGAALTAADRSALR